jgi:hypothetical protein
MAAQLQLLSVYFADLDERRHWRAALTRIAGVQSVVELTSGWLIAESPLGSASSRYLGTPEPLRFLLGEELFLARTSGVAELSRCLTTSPGQLDQFPGDFSCVRFEADGALHVARSCAGIPALYVATGRNFAAVSTRIEWIGLVVPDPPEIDWLPLALYATGWPCFPNSRSPLRGVHYLKRGFAAAAAPGLPVNPTRYWRPGETTVTPSREQQHHLASVVRASLFSELERHVSATGNHVTLFSGGIDSASVAAVIHALGRSQIAVSQLPPKDSPEWAREHRYIHGAPAWFSKHFIQEFSWQWALDWAVDGPPTYYPVGQYWLQVAAHGLRPASVAGGWFSDEVLGVLRIPDWVAGVGARDMARFFCHVSDPLHALRRWHQWRLLPSASVLPTSLPRSFASLVGGDYRTFREHATASRPRSPSERLHFVIESIDLAGISAETCAAFGGVSVQPFASRAIVETAAQTHPADLFYCGVPKMPLRAGLRGTLPDLYRNRRDSGDYTIPDRSRTLLAPERVAKLQAALAVRLDNTVFGGQSRLTWQDQADLGWILRIIIRHQTLHHDRQKLRESG